MNKLQVLKQALQNRKLQVKKPAGKVSGDEPASIQGGSNVAVQGTPALPLQKQPQGGAYNPGANPIQNKAGGNPQNSAPQSVNAKMAKPKGAIFFKRSKR